MIRLFLIFSVFTTGCKAPVEAPTELSELSRYLYREWSNPDPSVMASGVENLHDFLVDVDLSKKVLDRSWILADITEEDIFDIDWNTSRDPADAVGLGVAYASQWPVADHATLQTEPDQTPAEPTASRYERTFPQTTDPSCFPPFQCESLITESDITRQNLLMHVDFILFKDIRRVATEHGDAMAARSWIDRTWEGDNGKTALFQSYSIDVWIPSDTGVLRYQTLWTESDVGVDADDDLIVGTVKSAIDRAYSVQDEAIEELYH